MASMTRVVMTGRLIKSSAMLIVLKPLVAFSRFAAIALGGSGGGRLLGRRHGIAKLDLHPRRKPELAVNDHALPRLQPSGNHRRAESILADGDGARFRGHVRFHDKQER